MTPTSLKKSTQKTYQKNIEFLMDLASQKGPKMEPKIDETSIWARLCPHMASQRAFRAHFSQIRSHFVAFWEVCLRILLDFTIAFRASIPTPSDKPALTKSKQETTDNTQRKRLNNQ